MFGLEKLPAAAVHRNVTGVSPVTALPFKVIVPPEDAVYGPPVTATGATVQGGGGGGVLLGHGSSIFTSVPVEDVYPAAARNGMLLKLFSTTAFPGRFSGKR